MPAAVLRSRLLRCRHSPRATLGPPDYLDLPSRHLPCLRLPRPARPRRRRRGRGLDIEARRAHPAACRRGGEIGRRRRDSDYPDARRWPRSSVAAPSTPAPEVDSSVRPGPARPDLRHWPEPSKVRRRIDGTRSQSSDCPGFSSGAGVFEPVSELPGFSADGTLSSSRCAKSSTGTAVVRDAEARPLQTGSLDTIAILAARPIPGDSAQAITAIAIEPSRNDREREAATLTPMRAEFRDGRRFRCGQTSH